MNDADEDLALLAPGLIHELRHPLLGIKGGMELVEWKLGSAIAGLEEWKLIQRQVQRMEEFLHSYQALLSSGKPASSFFVVEEVVDQAVELLAFRLKRLGKRFDASHGSMTKVAWGEPSAALHAVVNVLVNAVDAAEEAGESARVQVRVVGGPTNIEVRVSDEGRGVPRELRRRLFEPRFTTKEPGKGTGLGLHIARTMMRKYGGAVRLVDEGDPARLSWAKTEFTVEIPARPD
ncbi:MAG: sensor histidine kinase [Myxococcales bacterium]|nr:HAMP domain-containing histidine kinase [Myxococcales bacterium]